VIHLCANSKHSDHRWNSCCHWHIRLQFPFRQLHAADDSGPTVPSTPSVRPSASPSIPSSTVTAESILMAGLGIASVGPVLLSWLSGSTIPSVGAAGQPRQ